MRTATSQMISSLRSNDKIPQVATMGFYIVSGVLLSFCLTYAPLYLPVSVRHHVHPSALAVWMPLAQILPPIFLWKRNRGIAIGFLLVIAMEAGLTVAMLMGLIRPV
jgi:hypothetical protein